jgi:thiol-disulfide isomerase/thioredoxin
VKQSTTGRYGNLPRLAAGLLVLGIGLLVLWQVGAFSTAGDTKTTDDAGRTVELQAADVSVETVTPAGLTVGLREGDVAPDFEFSTFDGDRVRLSDYRGHPVFINFWASWCGPCRAELPTIEVKLREHEADGLVVLGMNSGERIETAERFLGRLDVKLTAYGYDPGGDVTQRYSVPGLPTSYFIDANGVITAVIASALNESRMEDAIEMAVVGHDAAQN